MIARALLIAAFAAIAYAALGDAVALRPPENLWPIDAAGRALAGHATHVALAFTISCWWYALVALGVVAGLAAWRFPAWRARVVFSLLTTVIAWQTSDALKNVFQRERPAYWYLHQETSFSYSSGHAMFAVVVYGLWSYYFATSTLPLRVRRIAAAACAVWGLGVIWSRLALGAHFVTDLIGGVLLAAVMLGLATAIATALAKWRAHQAAARQPA